MSKIEIYHNPRCSKSRGALEILKSKFTDDEIQEIRYLDNPPSKERLAEICSMLACRPFELIRTGEALFKELGLAKDDNKTDQEWLQILSENPKLIERPIIVYQNRAVIGRPPEKVNELIA